MQKYDAIERGIIEHDIILLREAIGNICYTNRSFSNGEFDEVLSYIEKKGVKIKDEGLKGELVSEGKKSFSEEDFGDAVFELKENFCDERIADVKKIGRALYGTSKKPTPAVSQNNLNGAVPNVQSHQDTGNTKIIVGILVAVAIMIVLLYLIRR